MHVCCICLAGHAEACCGQWGPFEASFKCAITVRGRHDHTQSTPTFFRRVETTRVTKHDRRNYIPYLCRYVQCRSLMRLVVTSRKVEACSVGVVRVRVFSRHRALIHLFLPADETISLPPETWHWARKQCFRLRAPWSIPLTGTCEGGQVLCVAVAIIVIALIRTCATAADLSALVLER